MIRVTLLTLILLFSLIAQTQAYGPPGHAMVGAIADQRLTGSRTGVQIANLVDGLTLAEAALLPDDIKEWDKKPPSDPDTFHIPRHPMIEAQLVDFVNANRATNNDPNAGPPSHHWFHYTDVPVAGTGNYASGTTGRSKWDVVQMIPYCISVLNGDVAEANDRKITKSVAVILLAHYVGDIHQPLHVGAQYFDKDGNPIDPDTARHRLRNRGGAGIRSPSLPIENADRGRPRLKRLAHPRQANRDQWQTHVV